jgi:hypothetical protein
MPRYRRLLLTTLSALAVLVALVLVADVVIPEKEPPERPLFGRIPPEDLEGVILRFEPHPYDTQARSDALERLPTIEVRINPDGIPREPVVLITRSGDDDSSPWPPSRDMINVVVAVILTLAAAATLYRLQFRTRRGP